LPGCGSDRRYTESCALEGDLEGIGERRLRGDGIEIHAQMDDGLSDLRADATDDAVSTHQPCGGDRLQQMLCDERVNRRHACDVEDGDDRSGLHDALQKAFHYHLRALAIERADEREREDAVPQLDDRSGQLQHLLLLPSDDFLTALLMD